jgi:hypothetical protein
MRRASRGRFWAPVSWREVKGTEGLLVVGVGPPAAADVVGAAGTGWEVGEEDVWPLVWGGASPFTSAMVEMLWGLKGGMVKW